MIPPTPHPPHEHLAVLATPDGLLIRLHAIGVDIAHHVKISWGKRVEVSEQDGDGEDAHDWSESVVVYGIVGFLELFSSASFFVF
jgi:hypothetical protein